MGRIARRWSLRAVAVLALYLMIPDAPERRIEGPATIPVWVVDHGWHSGVVLRRADVPSPALRAAFPHAGWFEFGWGDLAFYAATPTFSDIDPTLAIPALLWPTPSAVHVVALDRPPALAFGADRVIELAVDTGGRAAIGALLTETFTAELELLGRGLYGDSWFFRARPPYHLFRVCNHWVSQALREAGLPSSWFWSTFSVGLMAELRLRS